MVGWSSPSLTSYDARATCKKATFSKEATVKKDLTLSAVEGGHKINIWQVKSLF
jgi:hypothetical protein